MDGTRPDVGPPIRLRSPRWRAASGSGSRGRSREAHRPIQLDRAARIVRDHIEHRLVHPRVAEAEEGRHDECPRQPASSPRPSNRDPFEPPSLHAELGVLLARDVCLNRSRDLRTGPRDPPERRVQCRLVEASSVVGLGESSVPRAVAERFIIRIEDRAECASGTGRISMPAGIEMGFTPSSVERRMSNPCRLGV